MLKPEYTRPEVNLDDIADGADALMRELFSESEYSRDMKLIYSYVSRNGIEKFIYREILTYTDVIQINFSDGASETDQQKRIFAAACCRVFPSLQAQHKTSKMG